MERARLTVHTRAGARGPGKQGWGSQQTWQTASLYPSSEYHRMIVQELVCIGHNTTVVLHTSKRAFAGNVLASAVVVSNPAVLSACMSF